ncbi:SWIM zinc finger family protein [Streptomyces spinoverrucosus]|nr:SWIM zinc finger family protein [Streptomyces spinoverrucosus]
MRRAVSTRRAVAADAGAAEAPGDGSDRAPSGASAAGVPDAPGEDPDPTTPARARPSTRPADVARDALRAARSEREAQARQVREDIEATDVEPEARSAYRSAPTPPRPTPLPRPATGSRRPRELGELLASAVKPPAPATATHERPPAHDPNHTIPSGPPAAAPAEGTTTPLPESAAAPAEHITADPNRATPSGPPAAAPGEGTTPHPEPAAAPQERATADPKRNSPSVPPAAAPAEGTTPHPEPAAAPQERATADPNRKPPSVPPAAAPPEGTTTPHPEPAAATPRVPRSMASPHRDGDLRRTFPAFPPRPSDEDAPFAETWWGNAWISALEQGALDVKRLARGRGYAQQGHVDAITVTPGLVLAYVRGSRPRPYRVQVRLRTLDDADWERFLDAAADRPGHIAALLDKEMPQALADGDVPLLPGPGDLDPHCSCPDRGHPCKHAAALCYQTARLLDADPFVLLLLRGRGERELLDALSRRNATRAARAAQEREPAPLPGIRATDALARSERPPLPPPLPAPPHPEQPPVYPAAPGGPDPFALDQLATDAAARAHAVLVTGHDPVAELTLWQDAVRLAAARPGSGLTAGTRALYSSLASAVGRSPAELARAVAAWRQGGLDGLAALEEPWDPPAGRFDRARPLLLAADLPAFRPWRNRLTHPNGHVQLRLGRDALWYAYESEPGRDDWWPRGTPDPDPVGALTGLGAMDEP